VPAETPFVLDTVLLKVASRCNLDCSYCYVYHMGDEGWRDQPKRMSAETGARIAEQLGGVFRAQQVPFSVVLHGGEPLLLGRKRLAELLAALRAELPQPCGLHIQTNGLLLSDDIIDVLIAYDVGVSISIDGPAETHDQFRVDHLGRGSHTRVSKAIARLRARPDAMPLFAGVLAVIDPRTDPAAVYASLKAAGAPGVDVLVRDGNWDRLPFGKAAPETLEYGKWLEGLLMAYLADADPPRVRLLDDLLRLILGGRSQKEGVGLSDYGILVIEPDGEVQKNDTLKVAHAGADRFETTWNVHRDRLTDILGSQAYAAYHAQQQPTSSLCQACPELSVCGGGMVAHRWRDGSGYENPTIFCADQKHLIAAMRATIAQLPALEPRSTAA
jgi:uncharacterized protein